ncbi:unnamed protein product [Arabidopsis halleri]
MNERGETFLILVYLIFILYLFDYYWVEEQLSFFTQSFDFSLTYFVSIRYVLLYILKSIS